MLAGKSVRQIPVMRSWAKPYCGMPTQKGWITHRNRIDPGTELSSAQKKAFRMPVIEDCITRPLK